MWTILQLSHAFSQAPYLQRTNPPISKRKTRSSSGILSIANMDIEQFRRAGYQAIDDICDYYYSLQDMPVVSNVEPGYLRRALPPTAPEVGEGIEQITKDYHNLIIPGLTLWQHPCFFAYFPTACSFEGILGDLYASGINSNPGFNWSASPACTELEAVMMDWAAEMLGLDSAFYNTSEVGGGVIQTTGSDAALVTIVVARSRYVRQHPGVPTEKLVLYTTTQTHSLGKKAGLILGLNVRALEVSAKDSYALRGTTLKQALDEDSRNGLYPFILISTVGSTSSCAIDHLEELGEIVASTPSMWLHVDAAWAGIAMACPEYRRLCLLDEINKYADSLCVNFHKWGLVNFDCSALWVRDRKNLTDALDVTPEFLRSKDGDAGTVVDYRNWHLGLGRRFRALKLWFVMRSYGVQGFQLYIREGRLILPFFVPLGLTRTQTIQRSDTFVSLIKQSAYFQLVTPPCLSLSVFRLEPPMVTSNSTGSASAVFSGVLDTAQLNALNLSFYARLSSRHDIAFTRTNLNGVICIRCAVGAQRTKETHIHQAFGALCEEAIETLKTWEREREPAKGNENT